MERFEPSGTIAMAITIAREAETVTDWDLIADMGVSCAVVYDFQQQQSRIYDDKEIDSLRACLDRADRIVTWNGWNFDLPVIYTVNRPDWPTSKFCERPGGSDG